MKPSFDALDEQIKQIRIDAWNNRSGPRVGDFVRMPDGALLRFTHDFGEEIQTTAPREPGDQSFYFGHGYCSFSGSLDSPILKSDLFDTGATQEGPVWFFHHDSARAHNGVHTTIPCRVYHYQPQPKEPS